MLLDATQTPSTDPTPIFEHYRGNYGTELLVAAAGPEFELFEKLSYKPLLMENLRGQLGLADRPFRVLTTVLRAMHLLHVDAHNHADLTPVAREHLLRNSPFFVGDYLALAAHSPGVREMVERLRTNRPAGAGDPAKGAAFIFRQGIDSAMELAASARNLTLALAGRAKNVAPHLAAKVDVSSSEMLLDVGGGTGIYSIACLQKFPRLRATVFDRPEVLKVAAEFAAEYGVQDRLDLIPGDMFADALPKGADAVLLSNILHDWDVPECRTLVKKCADALPAGGQLIVHDVFLHDDLSGPLPIALYSAALFSMTEGRAYSAGEYAGWMKEVGLEPGAPRPTLVHCGTIVGVKG